MNNGATFTDVGMGMQLTAGLAFVAAENADTAQNRGKFVAKVILNFMKNL